MHKFFTSLARLTVIALSVSLFWNTGITLAAFGVSPPWVENDLLLPGSTFEETIYLSRSDATTAMQAQIRISGDDEVLEWLSIPNADNLIIPQGENIYPMKVQIQVPENASPGEYKGGIMVKLAPIVEESLGGGQVAIVLGAHVSVDLTVTNNQVTDYKVEAVNITPQVVDEPFSVSLSVKNTGNTELDEVEGSIDVYDRSGTELIKTMAFVAPDEPVAFNETKEVEMVYDDFVPEVGEYWVQVKAVKDGETVYEDRLLQSVTTETIPVVTAKDALVQIKTQEVQEERITVQKKANGMYLILGLIGIGLGLIALAALRMVPTKEGRKKRR